MSKKTPLMKLCCCSFLVLLSKVATRVPYSNFTKYNSLDLLWVQDTLACVVMTQTLYIYNLMSYVLAFSPTNCSPEVTCCG